ncbi:hypothetical protein ACFL6I_28150 [candidate division KSB1 bacterium]
MTHKKHARKTEHAHKHVEHNHKQALHPHKPPVHKKGLWQEYFQSLKDVKSLTFLLIFAFDLVFFALMYPLIYLYGYFINRLIAPYMGLDVASLTSQSTDQLAIYQQSLTNLIVFTVLLTIALVLLLVLVWSVSRALIWTRLLARKMTFRYFGKFYLLNLVWIAISTIVLVFFGTIFYASGSANKILGIITGIIFLIVFITLVYLMYILYYVFTKGDNLVWKSLKEAFVLGTMRCPKLTLPVVLVLGTVVVSFATLLFKLLPKIMMDVLSYVVFFGVFAWVKIYAVDVLKERV